MCSVWLSGKLPGRTIYVCCSFPQDAVERDIWIKSLPNAGESLVNRSDLYVCASHFDCKWIVSRGGKRPVDPPSVFSGVPRSCLKQTKVTKRSILCTSSTARELKENERLMQENNMKDFASFLQQLPRRYPLYSIKNHGDDVYMSKLDANGRHVIEFLWFQKIDSPFGFLHLVCAEENGFQIQKHNFVLNKNSRVNKW